VPPKSINCGPLPVSEQNGVVWVAAAQPASSPTDFPGFDALKSLVIRATPSAIKTAAFGAPVDGGVSVELGGQRAVLLLSERARGEVFAIALVAAGTPAADRLKAAGALEALRRSAEAQKSLERQE